MIGLSSFYDVAIKLASDLIKIDSTNPPGYTNEVAAFIKDFLNSYGISSNTYEFEKNKTNLIAAIGKGSPTLILNGHMDVVPPGDEGKWEYPPFSGKIVGDKLFGRGASDMKSGLAVLISAAVELRDFIEGLGNGSILLVASADEEVGGHAGMQGLVESGLIKGDAAIIAEPSGYYVLSVGEKGLCQTKLITRGIPCHASLPIFGENAIMKMYNALEKAKTTIERLNEKINVPEDLNAVIDDMVKLYSRINKEGVNAKEFERQIKGISFSPGVIRGGNKINTVPDYCEVELDMRTPPGCICKNVRDALRKDLEGTAEVKGIDTSEASFTPLSEVIVRVAMDSISRVIKDKVLLRIETGATDGRYLRGIGIPTIIYGPGELFAAHSYNEYVKLNDIKVSLDATEEIIKNYFK